MPTINQLLRKKRFKVKSRDKVAALEKYAQKIGFDKNSLEFKGWKTKDSYSNDVSFTINNLKINNQIIDDFFKIPREEDL